MSRIALTSGEGWFDNKSSRCWQEDSWFDGSNHISCATGDQWDHEELYRTKGGAWVLCQWSQWPNRRTTYHRIDEEDAIAWLIAQSRIEESDLAGLPESLQNHIRRAIASREI